MSRHVTEIFQMLHRTFATCSMSLLSQIPVIMRQCSFIVQVYPSAIQHPSIFCPTAQSRSSRLLQTNSYVKPIILLIFSSTRKRLTPNLICHDCKCLFPPLSFYHHRELIYQHYMDWGVSCNKKAGEAHHGKKKCKMKKNFLNGYIYSVICTLTLFSS